MSRIKLLLGVSSVVLAIIVGAAVTMGQESNEQAPPNVFTPPAAEVAPAPAPQPVAGVLLQAKAVADAMQQQLRQKRLAVLKRLEAGEIDAEGALSALDDLPRRPSYFGGTLVWIKVEVREKEDEIYFAIPLSVIQWLLSEGPKMVPPEIAAGLRQQMGLDIATLDLSGLAMALDALSQVRQPTPLLRLKEAKTEISVTVEPAGAVRIESR